MNGVIQEMMSQFYSANIRQGQNLNLPANNRKGNNSKRKNFSKVLINLLIDYRINIRMRIKEDQ